MNDEKTNKIMSSEELDDVLPKYEPIKLSGKNLAQQYVSAFNTGMNIYQCINQLQGYIEWVVKAVNDVVKLWNEQVGESIDQSKSIVRETTTEQFNTEWTNKQPELIDQVNTLTTNQFNNEKSIFNDELNALNSRMDTFTRLSEGSTTGDAELQDIRVGANGVTYPNAGDAVRGQYSQLKEDLSEIFDTHITSIKMVQTSNQFDATLKPNSIIMTAGSRIGEYLEGSTILDNSATDKYFEIQDGKTNLVFSADVTFNFSVFFAFYDESKTVITPITSIVLIPSRPYNSITIPSNAKYYRISLYAKNMSIELSKVTHIQIEYGSTQSAYKSKWMISDESINIGGDDNEQDTFTITNGIVNDFIMNTNYPLTYDTTNVGSYQAEPVYYQKDYPSPIVCKWNENKNLKNLMFYYSTVSAIPVLDTANTKRYQLNINDTRFALYNLEPSKTYHWMVCGEDFDGNQVVVKKSSFTTSGSVRFLRLPYLSNVRDLGGWSVGSQKVKYGILYRGSELDYSMFSSSSISMTGNFVTEDSKKCMLDILRIRTEIDLRMDRLNMSPLGGIVEYNDYPIVPYDTGLKASDTQGYIKEIFEKIASKVSSGNGIYIHCQGGQDRTGTIAVLILGALGVSQSDIDKDYELTSFAYPSSDASTATTTRLNAKYVAMIEYLNTFNGLTFNDKVVAYLSSIGIAQSIINTLKANLIA